jgi:hypothetical protein
MGFGSEKHHAVTNNVYISFFIIIIIVIIVDNHRYRLYLITTSEMCQGTDTALS